MKKIFGILLLISSAASGQSLFKSGKTDGIFTYFGTHKLNAYYTITPADSLRFITVKHLNEALAGAGAQTIQQVLTTGDTATRRIYFRGIGDTTSSHTFFYNTVTPPNFAVTYTTYGMQRQFHGGFRYERGVNPSGRPNVILSPLSYNIDPGSTTRNNTGEAAYGFYYSSHIEQSGSKIFRFELPRIIQQDAFSYTPFAIETGKDARSSVLFGHMTSFSGYLLPAAGSALDSTMFSFASGGHLLRTFGNGSLTLQNARATGNSYVMGLTDNGVSFATSGVTGSNFLFTNPASIANTANLPSLSLSPGSSVTQPTLRITGGTFTGNKPLMLADVTGSGVATAIYRNASTTTAGYMSFQVQHDGGRPELVFWQNSNNYWINRLRGNSGDDSTMRWHYVGTDVLFLKKNGALGIRSLPGARMLWSDGSVGFNKDSLPTITSITSQFLVAQDSASGSNQGRLYKIRPSGLGFATQSALNDTAAAIRSAIGGGGGSSPYIYQFVSTQEITVSNTTTETTIYGTGFGSAGIDGTANVTAGTQIIFKGSGAIYTDAVVAGEVTFAWKLPTATISVPVTGLAGGLAASTYTYEFKAIPLGTGTGQDFIWFLEVFVENNGLPVIIKVTGRETGILTTTGTLTADVTVDWNTADADNTLISNFNTVEVIKK